MNLMYGKKLSERTMTSGPRDLPLFAADKRIHFELCRPSAEETPKSTEVRKPSGVAIGCLIDVG